MDGIDFGLPHHCRPGHGPADYVFRDCYIDIHSLYLNGFSGLFEIDGAPHTQSLSQFAEGAFVASNE